MTVEKWKENKESKAGPKVLLVMCELDTTHKDFRYRRVRFSSFSAVGEFTWMSFQSQLRMYKRLTG